MYAYGSINLCYSREYSDWLVANHDSIITGLTVRFRILLQQPMKDISPISLFLSLFLQGVLKNAADELYILLPHSSYSCIRILQERVPLLNCVRIFPVG